MSALTAASNRRGRASSCASPCAPAAPATGVARALARAGRPAHLASMLPEEPLTLTVGTRSVSGLLCRPPRARGLLVLGHGAGAGMRHHFMADVSAALADRDLATLRYQFPYMEEGRGRPDPPGLLQATVRAACDAAARLVPELPRFAGGKSLGGRMTSSAQAEAPLPGVRGLVFFGFPLHPPKRPGTARAEHLARITIPMLFLQGTRDDLADLDLIRDVTAALPPATLHVVDGANHSFEVLKRSGRTGAMVLAELADTVMEWLAPLA